MRRFLFLACLLAAASVFAQPDTTSQERLKVISADPAAQRSAIEAGKKLTFFCANCHGEAGVSKTPEVPNLAGQNPAYLLEQIRKFGAGERKDQFMQGLIKVLKDEERVQVAMRPGWRKARFSSPSCALAAMASRHGATSSIRAWRRKRCLTCRPPSRAIGTTPGCVTTR
jgi:cytochrome c553